MSDIAVFSLFALAMGMAQVSHALGASRTPATPTSDRCNDAMFIQFPQQGTSKILWKPWFARVFCLVT
jgi:hypothetical protein